MDKKGLNTERIGDYLFKGGLLLAALSFVLFFLIFYPSLREEIKFVFSSKNQDAQIVLADQSIREENKKEIIVPADENFSLIIPKIGANEKVIAEVNPFDQAEYMKALKEGIAHAGGSSLPGEGKNIFLFAHSSGNFYQNNRLNTIFFLLNKLENGDQFSIVYQGEIYNYEIYDKKTVADDQVEYMQSNADDETVTLMTCWPPGTSYKRLLVFGKPI